MAEQIKRINQATIWGPVVSLFAALCCLGAAPLLAALSAVGLGFVIHDAILIPLLAAAMGFTIWALNRDRPRHGNKRPLSLAALALPLTVGGLWVSSVAVGAGLVLLVAASIGNVILMRQTRAKVAP